MNSISLIDICESAEDDSSSRKELARRLRSQAGFRRADKISFYKNEGIFRYYLFVERPNADASINNCASQVIPPGTYYFRVPKRSKRKFEKLVKLANSSARLSAVRDGISGGIILGLLGFPAIGLWSFVIGGSSVALISTYGRRRQLENAADIIRYHYLENAIAYGNRNYDYKVISQILSDKK